MSSRQLIRSSVPMVLNTTKSSAEEVGINPVLLAPGSSDSVVEIDVLNHPRVRGALADLGIADADLVPAGRLRNPRFSFGRLSGNGEVEIDRAIMFDLSGLLSIPLRRAIEERRFEQTQLQTALQIVRLAKDTRRAYFQAVSAPQWLVVKKLV